MIFLFSCWDQIKVNGQDISTVSLREALEILQSAEEQVTLEARREKPPRKPPQTSDATTQTEASWWDKPCPNRGHCIPSCFDFYLDSSYRSYLLPQDCNDGSESDCLLPTSRRVEKEEPDYETESEGEESQKQNEQMLLLHQDWDSGVCYTDGSTQLDEHSGPSVEAEDPAAPKGSGPGHFAVDTIERSGPATEDLLSNEESSDSSFCGVNPEEFRKFQEILEGKCNQYQFYKALHRDQRASEVQEEGSEQCRQREQWLVKRPSSPSSPECLPLAGDSTVNTKKEVNRRAELCPRDSVNGDARKSAQRQTETEDTSLPPTSFASGPKTLAIPHHARRYMSYMNLVQEKVAVECLSDQPRSSAPPGQCSKGTESNPGDAGCTRRVPNERSKPLLKKQHKSQLLKDRALRITEERSGMTTDDDALSELKTGKYWNKAQRRQHLLLSKEQKQRKEFMMQSRMGQLTEDGAGTMCRKDLGIIELSQKKLMKRRSRKVLDNWITIQELLTHGTKSLDGRTTYSPLLSVTTV
ncbi:hypothetical protein Y1Q_0003386 [Alligator mississippiensis]|uniref:Uncharacterized protein n=1 Tax=Alligator mississippiensis TaxID=8496 RepID=A0A151MAV6_ALLMI|nr:hypothetical protein Y1Q_0003386 [Alligator mississippiensis]